MAQLPTPAELEAILAWQKAHVFEGSSVRMEPSPRKLPAYKATGPAEVSVLDPAWKPTPAATAAYIAAHWECESRGEARREVRRQELERLAQVAERALELRAGLALLTQAALGNLIEIGGKS
ncbi:MAG: hypothetical protein Q8R78_05855 [Candidatus Omnitrophota bacterium]|nr:hypothetical protein [Candidatus Omnitrophota bacterium]